MTLLFERRLIKKLVEDGSISSLDDFTEFVAEALRKYTEEEDVKFSIQQTQDNILKVKTGDKKFKITIRDITPDKSGDKEEPNNFKLFAR